MGAAIAHRLASAGIARVALGDADAAAAELAAAETGAAVALDGAPAPAPCSPASEADALAGAAVVVIAPPAAAGEEAEARAERLGRLAAARAPAAVVVVACEPSAALCEAVLRGGVMPRGRVVGCGGAVAAARLRALVAAEVGVDAAAVDAIVLARGDGERPRACAAVAGVPAPLAPGRLDELARAALEPPAGPVVLAAAGASLARAVAVDAVSVRACTARCEGEYGVDGAFAAVPAMLGPGGVERIVELAALAT